VRAVAALLGVLLVVPAALAFTPNSPEVKQAVAKAVKFLESPAATDHRTGAMALAGLAILKSGGAADHPKVVAAVQAISAEVAKSRDPSHLTMDIYSTGFSIIFLVTLQPASVGPQAGLVQQLLASLRARQKPHGGWGYPDKPTGDTSMTQYGVLSSWEAAQVGYPVASDSIERVTLWLIRTQDPSGGFGYQGQVPMGPTLIRQSDVRVSVSVAGLGSAYICADLLGLSELSKQREAKLPPALKELRSQTMRRSHAIDARALRELMARGNQYMATRMAPEMDRFVYYYLYGLERYWSFREAMEGKSEPEPAWYNDGVRFLLRYQKENGSWDAEAGASGCGPVPDTGFGILFLVRSSRRSIERARDFGSGVLIGGRGLPRDAQQLVVRGGQVVNKPLLGPAERLLASIDDVEDLEADSDLEGLAELGTDDVRTLVSRHGEKLRRLAGSGSPEARAAALRTLAKARNLDHVPVLIYALRDPDPRVVREAEEGLRWISRRIGGQRLPDTPSEAERQQAIKAWKAWYLAIRPDAQFEE